MHPLPLRSLTIRRLSIAGALVFLGACSDGTAPAVTDEPTNDRIILNNDESSLAGRITYTSGRNVPLSPVDQQASVWRMSREVPSSVAFSLEAVVDPPFVAGQAVQATHVALDGKYVYVSYMTTGESWLGAVDVFDIDKPDQPRLVSQAVFKGTDIVSLAVDGGYLYLATSTGDAQFAEHAVLERIQLKGGKLTTTSKRVGLASYVATGVDLDDGRVFVTSGTGGPNTGGLTILDAKTLQLESSDVFADARGVSAVSSKYVGVSQGSPATLRLYNPKTRAFLRSVGLSGGGIAGSKSSLVLTDEWGFVATGDGGMQVVDLSLGAVVATHDRPVVAGSALEDALTNSVSLSRELVLTADGGAGVTVSYSDYHKRKSGERPSLNALGRLALPGSANQVGSNDETLFVANGTGGLQILSIKTQ